MERRFSVETEAFYRKKILPEEDRLALTGEPSKGGFRWFRSENVVCIEHYRPIEAKPAPRLKAS
jgi:hypothetical protein